jgi:hypothetical protein
MKVIYQFDHDEDHDRFNIFQQAEGMHSVLWELDQELRRVVKYEDNTVDQNFAIMWRAKLHELMEGNQVDIYG